MRRTRSLAGDVRAVGRMPSLLWREAGRQDKDDQGGLLATAVGASLLGAKVNLRRGRDGLATPFAEWRDYGRAILARHAYAPQDAEAAPEAAGLKRSLKARRPPAAEPGSAVLFPSSILEGVGRSDNVKELKRILADVLDVRCRACRCRSTGMPGSGRCSPGTRTGAPSSGPSAGARATGSSGGTRSCAPTAPRAPASRPCVGRSPRSPASR